MISISEVKPYANNAKMHNDEQIKKLAKIVQKIGWRSNVLVNNKTGEIIVGHGRFQAWEKFKDKLALPDIWVMDDLGNTIFGEISKKPMSKQDEKMYRIADNKVAELAEIDLEMIKLDMKSLDLDYQELTCYADSELMDKVYSDKNKEVVIGDLSQDLTLKIKFSNYEKYLKCLEMLNILKEEQEIPDSELLYNWLSNI